MSTRDFSSKQEQYVANFLDGTVVRNSGATTLHKGDVVTDKVLVECKTSTKPKKQFTIKKEWLDKNRAESMVMGKELSALIFDFGVIGDEYVVITLNDFKNLLGGD